MKVPTTLYLIWQLLAALSSQAQTVIQGDSSYFDLRPGKDSTASVMARLGRRYRKKEILTWYYGRLRDGGSISGTNVIGYALYYKRIGVSFCVKNEKGHLDEIHFDSTASVVSARGIRPGAASFADVIKRYGLPLDSDPNGGVPKIAGFWAGDKHLIRRHYLTLSYPTIRFVSWGNRGNSENLLARPVQEIWLR
ncbi:MAG: hypothetical protein ACRYFX_28050 [Janthinobacterium lividum]